MWLELNLDLEGVKRGQHFVGQMMNISSFVLCSYARQQSSVLTMRLQINWKIQMSLVNNYLKKKKEETKLHLQVKTMMWGLQMQVQIMEWGLQVQVQTMRYDLQMALKTMR
jgi:hypothetical protein